MLVEAIERMFSRVTENALGCWIYPGQKSYIKMSINNHPHTMHRVSYEYFNGPIPDGLDVLHHCDIKACLNPDHLYVGTDQDNANDRVSRGRNREQRGEYNSSSKLTDDDVRWIRDLKGKATQAVIAELFNISRRSVGMIHSGKTWTHVD